MKTDFLDQLDMPRSRQVRYLKRAVRYRSKADDRAWALAGVLCRAGYRVPQAMLLRESRAPVEPVEKEFKPPVLDGDPLPRWEDYQ